MSTVEQFFLSQTSTGFLDRSVERIPVLTMDNYVTLGKVTALRFLEWAADYPQGVVALPTGRTPEFFIKWLQYFLTNWTHESRTGILAQVGLNSPTPPVFDKLWFVQIDEFFPLDPRHERSFNHYVRTFYLEKFGFDKRRALLLDTSNIQGAASPLLKGVGRVERAFPDGIIDLSLRFRHPGNEQQALQRAVIRHFDQFCEDYEERIRALGGLGFFLGGIGPDGHIAFNVRGSSHHSATRLTSMNYETMAAAAQDLGGIEEVRKKAVITIGLETITYNPECVAIVFAAGEAKAGVVEHAVVKEPALEHPATALQKLPHARFYVTRGAASGLACRSLHELQGAGRPKARTLDRLMLDGARTAGVGLDAGSPAVAQWAVAAELAGRPSPQLAASALKELTKKIELGLSLPDGERILHTAPHHDDIELAYFPLIHHLVRSPRNENFFCYLTSGFTSVTNAFVLERLRSLAESLEDGSLKRMWRDLRIADPGLRAPEIHGYLNAVAQQNAEGQRLYTSVRLCRRLCGLLATASPAAARRAVSRYAALVGGYEPGRTDPETVREIKSWIREWEAELAWAHFGLDVENTHHLRLRFYTGAIFPSDPTFRQDVVPIVKLLERVRPTVVTLAMDPEGSGPDTHFKCLLALREALRTYVKKHRKSSLRVWGYRNVWSRFHPAEVERIVPVSLNSLAVLDSMFNTCFQSQRAASFPSFEMDAPFSKLAQKVWVEQFNDLRVMLGEGFFYQDRHPLMRRAYGAIYLRDMSYGQFLEETASLEKLAGDKRLVYFGLD